MGLRFRKSFKIFPGVKLNFNKKSIGLSFGTRGARVSVNSDGRKTTSLGLPGTGLYWVDSRKNPRKDDEVSFFGCFMWILLLPFILVIVKRNQMMAYIEKNAYKNIDKTE